MHRTVIALKPGLTFEGVQKKTGISEESLRKWVEDIVPQIRWKLGERKRKKFSGSDARDLRFQALPCAAATRVVPIMDGRGLASGARAGRIPGLRSPGGWRIFVPIIKPPRRNKNPALIEITDLKTGKVVHWIEVYQTGVDEVIKQIRLVMLQKFAGWRQSTEPYSPRAPLLKEERKMLMLSK